MGKVGGSGAGGKAGNPVSSADGGLFAQLKDIEVHGHGEGIDARASGHGKMAGIDPGQADAGSGMQAVAVEMLEADALEGPGERNDKGLMGQRQQAKGLQSWNAKCR